MICNIFKPSRRDKNGKKVRRRLWWGQYRLDGETRITRISLRTPDKQVARGRLDTIVKERQQERDGLIAPQTVRECADRDLSELIDLHADDLEARGRDDEYVRIVRARLKKLARPAAPVRPMSAQPLPELGMSAYQT